jgi:hypothetical protein
VYVLHAFQKKSKQGIATTKRDIELIRQRLSEAGRQHHEAKLSDQENNEIEWLQKACATVAR